MEITFQPNEIIDYQTASYLMLFCSKSDKKELITDLIDNHIEDIFELYRYIKTKHDNYRQRDDIISSNEKLQTLEDTIGFTQASFNERLKVLAPHKDKIQEIANEIRGYSYYRTTSVVPYLYYDVYVLGLELDNIKESYMTTYGDHRIESMYKYIIEPLQDNKITLDSETRKGIFEIVQTIFFRKVKTCISTNSHLGTIKSSFNSYENMHLQYYLKIYDFFNDHFDEFACDKYVSKEAYDHFLKKFKKWACSELIK